MPIPYVPPAVAHAFMQHFSMWTLPITACAQLGISSADKITDIIFMLRHPERGGKPLAVSEKGLIKEWMEIKAQVVKILDSISWAKTTPVGSGPQWLRYARGEMLGWHGVTEGSTSRDNQYFQASPYFGGKTHVDGLVPKSEMHWCAAFVNWCLHCAGFSHTGNASNNSFLKTGLWHFNALEEPKEGCIIVLGHGVNSTRGNHVSFLSSWKDLPTGRNVGDVTVSVVRRVSLLGGNQSDTVMDKSFYNVKLHAATGQNGVKSPYLWPLVGPSSCSVKSVPSEAAHFCGRNPLAA